jgi:hypothetical protein
MQRTLNYTGRSKIEKQHALFSFGESNGRAPVFNVEFNIDADDYAENASVYVEAYHKETRQRFDFGTIEKIKPPVDRRLDQIDLSGPTFFRVLIVDESGRHGMLLASGDQFRADTGDDEENKSSILAVRKYPMGQVSWRVYIAPGTAPELHLNSQINSAIEKMKSDPEFQALILPAAFRAVLTYYLWNDEDADGNEHYARWMAFASMFAEEKPDSNDPADLLRWIDEVVTSFSERFNLNDMLVNSERGDNQ